MMQIKARETSQQHTPVGSLLQIGKSDFPVDTSALGRPGVSLLASALMGALTAVVWLWPSIPFAARVVLWVYGLAVIAWAVTSVNAGIIGLAAVVALLAFGVVPQDWVTDILLSKVVWLILGAYLLGEALTRTGLAYRLMAGLAAAMRTPRGLAWRLTGALLTLAFLVPSTTGRAAMLLPLVRSLPHREGNGSRRCLGLLIPCIVLVSTPVTLTGAAAHLLANEMLSSTGQTPLSFSRWLLLAGPFGVAVSILTAWLIIRRHLPQADEPLPVTELPAVPWSRAEWTTLGVLGGMLLLWLTTGLHSLSFTAVMLLGVIVLMAPVIGVLDWKEATKAIPWDLLIFAGSAVWLGKALVESGASGWLVGQVVGVSGLAPASSPLVVLILLGVVAVSAHLYLMSHTARVAALVPPLLALAGEFGWNPTAVVLVTVIGIDYCLTLPICSKAILMYELDRGQAADLFRLSLILMPTYLLLLIACYFVWWVPLGLSF